MLLEHWISIDWAALSKCQGVKWLAWLLKPAWFQAKCILGLCAKLSAAATFIAPLSEIWFNCPYNVLSSAVWTLFKEERGCSLPPVALEPTHCKARRVENLSPLSQLWIPCVLAILNSSVLVKVFSSWCYDLQLLILSRP